MTKLLPYSLVKEFLEADAVVEGRPPAPKPAGCRRSYHNAYYGKTHVCAPYWLCPECASAHKTEYDTWQRAQRSVVRKRLKALRKLRAAWAEVNK